MVSAQRVLIVEDDRIVRMHLRITLKELGYEVTGVAASAEEALRMAGEVAPQVVLMDVRLEGDVDGIEAARELRRRHDVVVVFLTAFADAETVKRSNEVGSAGFIVKPFVRQQLSATLASAFAERERERMASAPAFAAMRTGGGLGARVEDLQPFGAGSRLAIFSHDTMGLGHLQRNLNIAWSLSRRFPDLSILILTGSSAVHRFPLPPRVDYVKLPSVRKNAAESYGSRSLQMSDEEVRRFRSNLTLRTICDYDPHVLLVDHAPLGMKGELLPTLEWLERERPNCVKVAGLRDVLDGPERVRELWTNQGIYGVLDELYDHIVVYGSREVFDPASAYGFPPALTAKTTYSNYIRRVERDGEAVGVRPFADGGRRQVVVTIGGGDGYGEEVIGTYLEALRLHREEVDFESTLLTGPFLDPLLLERFRAEARDLPVTLVEFVQATRPYLEHSDLVVSTCGYNTMVETLCFGRRALVIPRRMHRLEQVLRAERLRELGLVECLLPEEISPERLYREVRRQLDDPRERLVDARAAERLRFDGTERIAELFAGLRVESTLA